MIKVKVTVAILEILFHRISAFIHGPILKPLHIIVYYDNTLDKFAFQHCRSKVKLKVAIFRKTLSLGMTIPQRSLCFRFLGSRSRSPLLFLEILCHRSSAFIYGATLKLLHIIV